MFRRRVVVIRRPRLLGAALIGGLGFAAGRASRNAAPSADSQPSVSAPADLTTKLRELSDLHASGALSDAEFAAAKAKLLS